MEASLNRLGSRYLQAALVPALLAACLWGLFAIFGLYRGFVALRIAGSAMALALIAAIAAIRGKGGLPPAHTLWSARLLAGGIALLTVGSVGMGLIEPYSEFGAGMFGVGVLCLVHAAVELVREGRATVP